jgi:Fe-S-cluster formation regulator IscX/YfhJ
VGAAAAVASVRRIGAHVTDQIDPQTRARLFEVIYAHSEIRDLLVRGTNYGGDPDEYHVSEEIVEALQIAKGLSRSIAPDVDPETIDFANLFLAVRLEVTKHLR